MVISTSGFSDKDIALYLGSLFTSNDESISNEFSVDAQNFSYKLFSFNFKIPKTGWERLNDIMYAENPYFTSEVLTNAESGLIDTDLTPLSALRSFENSDAVFEGELSFIYLVLNNRTVETIVGSGNYR